MSTTAAASVICAAAASVPNQSDRLALSVIAFAVDSRFAHQPAVMSGSTCCISLIISRTSATISAPLSDSAPFLRLPPRVLTRGFFAAPSFFGAMLSFLFSLHASSQFK